MSACPFCQAPMPEARRPAEGVALIACTGCFNPYVAETRQGVTSARMTANARDIRVVAPPGSIGEALLRAMPKAIEKLPTLPEVSQRVLLMVRDPEVSMTQLAEVIRRDPVIALAIMKLANSAMYGGLQEVKDLGAACARLGMKTIANAVQVVAANNIFISGDKRLRDLMQRLWRHSIGTAHCAGAIAALLSEPRTEALFLAGLIHDVGKVVLFEVISGSYEGGVAGLRATPELMREVIAGFHPLAGLHVVQQWNLPAEFANTTFAHHDPALCPNDADLAIVHTVALANIVAQCEGYTLFDKPDVFLVTHPSARYLNLSDIKIAGLRIDLADTLEALFQAAGGQTV